MDKLPWRPWFCPGEDGGGCGTAVWIIRPGQHQLGRGAGGHGTGMPSLRAFSSPWQLCPMGSTAGVARPLASQEPWPPRARSRGSVRALSRASASGRAEAPGLACVCWCSSAQTHPQAGVLPSCLAPQALTGPPLWGLCWSAAARAWARAATQGALEGPVEAVMGAAVGATEGVAKVAASTGAEASAPPECR